MSFSSYSQHAPVNISNGYMISDNRWGLVYSNYTKADQSISSLTSSSGGRSLTATDNPDAATATEAISALGFVASESSEDEEEEEDEVELLLSDFGEFSASLGA